jgi:hypothetical protein
MQRHPRLLELFAQEELMRQLAGEPVQVMHQDGLHQPLTHQVSDVGELRPIH